ncbi:hypothetical protein AcV7_002387 [Taiwanofungus camphoratus]|nr:hypothetical protein AcV7_002387 [Antrodia cinnamomea]
MLQSRHITGPEHLKWAQPLQARERITITCNGTRSVLLCECMPFETIFDDPSPLIGICDVSYAVKIYLWTWFDGLTGWMAREMFAYCCRESTSNSCLLAAFKRCVHTRVWRGRWTTNSQSSVYTQLIVILTPSSLGELKSFYQFSVSSQTNNLIRACC